jgi:hypothetical protein
MKPTGPLFKGRGSVLLTSKILFMNLKTTLPYILAIILSSSATSTTRYQYKRLPSTSFCTPRAIKKSVSPLSS